MFILKKGRVVPIGSCKDGMPVILHGNLLQQGIQDFLFTFKVAVHRRLADADSICDLRNRGRLKALYRKKIQRCLQNLLFCIALFHRSDILLMISWIVIIIIPTER